MPTQYTEDYLLDKRVKIFQPVNGYRASSDAVLLSAAVSEIKSGAEILDVGSGTGAVSLCLAQRLKSRNVAIRGVELQAELADLANLSATANNFDFVHFYHADIRQKLQEKDLLPCSFDVVITNPPYSEHDMPSPNPSKATAHNHHNFDRDKWLAFCLKMTKPFGHIYMINRVEALVQICAQLQGKAGGLTILPIYSKSGQEAKRVIVRAQKDSRAPCRILPPFITHDADGKYTATAEKIVRAGIGFADIFST